MTQIDDLITRKVNVESQIAVLQENLGGIKSKILECQYPETEICNIIKEYSKLMSISQFKSLRSSGKLALSINQLGTPA